MERFKRYRFIGIFVMLSPATTYAGHNIDNRLNWIEVSQTKLSTQIMFDFAKPIHFSPEVVKDERRLYLSFPGMNLESFHPDNVIPKLEDLKTMGLLQKVELSLSDQSSDGVDLALQFHPYRELKKNRFLIKWSRLENPNRLIINIYMKEDLEQLTSKDAVLLHAENDTVIYDSTPAKPVAHTTKAMSRIIIDPGHGGTDTGTKGFLGLLEKDIALDVAKRVQVMLKKHGCNALMTRNSDKDISLVQRAELAYQMNADLFVSIHVNSSGTPRNPAWGIETFYLDGDGLLPQSKQSGVSFFNLKKNNNLTNHLQQHMRNTQAQSKKLARSIQNNVISSLTNANIIFNNRGIKPEKFRIFLHTSVPVALVEVGFLTNAEDAYRLSKKPYRNLIARGISDGIYKFLQKASTQRSSFSAQ